MIYLVAGVVIVLAIAVGVCVWSWLGVDREAEMVNLRYDDGPLDVDEDVLPSQSVDSTGAIRSTRR